MLKTRINNDRFVGTFFSHEDQNLPGVMVVPGSEGGIPEELAENIAKQGYNVLALGYFGAEGLPPVLEEIPLEYFAHATEWLKARNEMKKGIIGLIGYSRGGELALILGSTFPKEFKAIVAYAPCSAICGAFPYVNKPAWTFNGKPVSKTFLGGLTSESEDLSEAKDLENAVNKSLIPFHANTAEDPYSVKDLFLARGNQRNLLEKAAIPVEKINCPLLLLSGEDDQIWPSSVYCQKVIERLDTKCSTIPRRHISYPKTGHGLTFPYDGPIYHHIGGFWCKLGGEKDDNEKSYQLAEKEVLQFLKANLK